MSAGREVLIYMIEDDAVIAELLEYNLRSEGFAARRFADGQDFFRQLGQLAIPDLFILDLMLPGMDGYEICRRLRSRPAFELVPILILTARSSEGDKVLGLETGADDYLTKPFGMRELMARVRALLRRYQKIGEAAAAAGESAGAAAAARPATSEIANAAGGAATSAATASATTASASSSRADGAPVSATGNATSGVAGQVLFRGILLDDARHRVFKDGREVEMTNREYELLKYLMTHPGIAFNRDDLLSRVWGYDYAGETRTVDVHIRQLRRKLGDGDSGESLIETVRGRGYRWSDQP